LPYPIFEGGEKTAFQRGGGICVTKSDEAREYAACLFLNWLTEAERNLYFCVNIGYMPVRSAAFERIMAGNYPAIENPVAEKTLLTVTAMQEDYRFYFPPVFDGFDALQTQYAEELRAAAQVGRDEYLRLIETMDEEAAFRGVSDGAMENYIRAMEQK
jgi:multiple sugar transport system substrate-binding protein